MKITNEFCYCNKNSKIKNKIFLDIVIISSSVQDVLLTLLVRYYFIPPLLLMKCRLSSNAIVHDFLLRFSHSYYFEIFVTTLVFYIWIVSFCLSSLTPERVTKWPNDTASPDFSSERFQFVVFISRSWYLILIIKNLEQFFNTGTISDSQLKRIQ